MKQFAIVEFCFNDSNKIGISPPQKRVREKNLTEGRAKARAAKMNDEEPIGNDEKSTFAVISQDQLSNWG